MKLFGKAELIYINKMTMANITLFNKSPMLNGADIALPGSWLPQNRVKREDPQTNIPNFHLERPSK